METNNNRAENFTHFANRLDKVYKHTGKWARKQGITCFRVYDNDMPDFPFAIDIYGNILHVSEYARPHGMEPTEHSEWLEGCMDVMAGVLGVNLQDIYLKFRQRQEGLRQYEKFDRKGLELTIQENGLKFIINPADYLDTGLFLDHRNTRAMVRDRAAGKSVLNLFAYTGSFTVYAAAGDAASTDTLDLSNTYLKWAQRNLTINELDGPQHRFLQVDVLDWLSDKPTRKWDLIVLDPPTFSNSKRMRGTLDIQRDHTWILHRALDRLNPGGEIFFSTNLKKFKLEVDAFPGIRIKNISGQTIANDYRDKRIHHCFLVSEE